MDISNNGIMTLSSPLQHKHGTSEALEASDYVLAAGEIITATDTGDIRAGNGTKTWKELPSSLSEVTNTEIHALTDEEITAKAFSLNSAVATGKENQVILFISGVAQAAGTDFIASGNTISWEDKGLDDIELKAGDVLVIHYIKTRSDSGLNGSSINVDTLKALISNADVLMYHNAGTHNALYRGKNLGSSITEEQSAAIRAGTFEGIYVGDYWEFENVPYSYVDENDETQTDTYSGIMRVTDCDYYFKCGKGSMRGHHIMVVPDTSMFNAKMNDTDTTDGGYTGSKMHSKHLKRAEAIFNACFGMWHIFSFQEYLVNAVMNGIALAGDWYTEVCHLLDERMVYGSCIYDSAKSDGSVIANRESISCRQLNLFRHRPDLIGNEQCYWLRNIVSTTDFACVDIYGTCTYFNASSPNGVRPYALIY